MSKFIDLKLLCISDLLGFNSRTDLLKVYNFMILVYSATTTINFRIFRSSQKETSYSLAVSPYFAQIPSPFYLSSFLELGNQQSSFCLCVT